MQTVIMTPALASEQYADWVVDRVPGAREAHDEYLAADAESRAAEAVVSENRRNFAALRRTDPHSHDIEDGEREVADAERTARPLAKRAERALDSFRSIVNRGRGNVDVKREAARRALEYHARAASALSELEATVDFVDAAWVLAGQPGRSWRANAFGDTRDSQRLALRALRERIDGFDVERVTEAAEGAEVETELYGDALARQLAKTTTAIVLR